MSKKLIDRSRNLNLTELGSESSLKKIKVKTFLGRYNDISIDNKKEISADEVKVRIKLNIL